MNKQVNLEEVFKYCVPIAKAILPYLTYSWLDEKTFLLKFENDEETINYIIDFDDYIVYAENESMSYTDDVELIKEVERHLVVSRQLEEETNGCVKDINSIIIAMSLIIYLDLFK